eukprot:359332-Chlamydomonas_euryale.AAC.6
MHAQTDGCIPGWIGDVRGEPSCHECCPVQPLGLMCTTSHCALHPTQYAVCGSTARCLHDPRPTLFPLHATAACGPMATLTRQRHCPHGPPLSLPPPPCSVMPPLTWWPLEPNGPHGPTPSPLHAAAQPQAV